MDKNLRKQPNPALSEPFIPGHTQLFCCMQQFCSYVVKMTPGQFKRWLAKQGCIFEAGKGGHLIVRLDGKMSVLPMHGSRKEIGKGLENRIKKDLELK
jgi:mRNA interferase HicA